MSKTKKRLLFVGSFFLPFLLLLFLWTLLGLAPFGNNNLLVSDLGTQYMPFLSTFKTFFQGSSFSLYSFSDALGGSILPLSAYYLLSPFNLLVLLFSYEQLPIAILLIITLKISSMGSALFYYLDKTYSRVSLGTLLFSTAYSLCGFVTVYCLNFMWLDALILLPLIVLGLQRLWDKKNYWLYCVSLFLAIVTNYYMGYMLCLFAVCYSVYWYFRSPVLTEKKSTRNFLKTSRLFFVASFFTGISTSFILLPAIDGMLSTKKTSFDITTFLPLPNFGLDFFSQFSLGSINFALRLEHLPTVFSGTFILLLIVAYFQLRTIPKQAKIATAGLLGFIFLSFWLEGLNTVWHMFQSPAGFPYRNTFIFSFLLIKFAYEAYLAIESGEKMSRWVPTITSLILVTGLLALVFSRHAENLLSLSYGGLTLAAIWLFYGLFCLQQQQAGGFRLLIQWCLLLLVCCELVFNFWISLYEIPFGNQQQFAKTYSEQEHIITSLSKNDTTLYRLKQTVNAKDSGYHEINNGYNNPMLYRYAGVSSYTSTLDANTQDTLTALGLYQKNDRRIAYVDDSSVINLLLNVSYQLAPEEKQGHQALEKFDTTYVYQNKEAVGMGFMVPPKFGTLALVEEAPLNNQEHILQAISQQTEPYFQATRAINWEETSQNHYSVTAETTASGSVSLYIPGLDWRKITEFKVNGQVIKPAVYIATNQVFNLGYFDKGQQLQLEFISETPLVEEDLELKTLQQEAFNRLINQQRQQALSLSQDVTGTLTGSVQVDDMNSLLYLAIPFDKNWSITVDGKKVTPKKVLGNFMGISLSAGAHTLQLHYQQKMFIIGSISSISVLFIVCFYQLLQRLRLRKKSEQ